MSASLGCRCLSDHKPWFGLVSAKWADPSAYRLCGHSPCALELEDWSGLHLHACPDAVIGASWVGSISCLPHQPAYEMEDVGLDDHRDTENHARCSGDSREQGALAPRLLEEEQHREYCHPSEVHQPENGKHRHHRPAAAEA